MTPKAAVKAMLTGHVSPLCMSPETERHMQQSEAAVATGRQLGKSLVMGEALNYTITESSYFDMHPEEYLFNVLQPALRPAHRWEFQAWLYGYMKQNVHSTDPPGKMLKRPYLFCEWPLYVLIKSMTIRPLHGALRRNILVPERVNAYIDDPHDVGHNRIFFMYYFHMLGDDIPIFQGVDGTYKPWWTALMLPFQHLLP